MLWDCILRMLSISGRWVFCRFWVSVRLATRGDSMPRNMLVKLASCSNWSSFGFSATLMVISRRS